jgi:sugar/nucleoside kinase (ribokinase family)
MITVAGEALIDLVVDRDGRVRARPGGGPFNTARTIGRLGRAPAFLGRLSQDSFGHLLRASLDQDSVTLAVPQLADAPTTLAVVDVDAAGAPRYRFYLAGTSSCALEYPLLSAALPDGVTALHSGSLALVMEPIATSIERLIASDVPPDTLVMIDPNCRSPTSMRTGPGSPASCAAPMWSSSAWKTSPTSTRAQPPARRPPPCSIRGPSSYLSPTVPAEPGLSCRDRR